MKNRYFLFPKNSYLRTPRKNDFFGFPIIGFLVRNEERFFRFQKSLFQGAMTNRFFLFPKNRFFRAVRKCDFSVSEISLLQCARRKPFFGFQKIAFSGRNEKRFYSVSEKSFTRGRWKIAFFLSPKNRLIQCAMKKLFPRIPKRCFFRAPRKSNFFGILKIAFSSGLRNTIFRFPKNHFFRAP